MNRVMNVEDLSIILQLGWFIISIKKKKCIVLFSMKQMQILVFEKLFSNLAK